MPTNAGTAVETDQSFFGVVAYALVGVVGVDEGELYLPVQDAVPFFSVDENLGTRSDFGRNGRFLLAASCWSVKSPGTSSSGKSRV